MEKKTEVRIHRVGTFTSGVSMVVLGILCLLHITINIISYRHIFIFWPCILICLGVELLLSNIFIKEKFVYDKVSIFLIILMTIFAMCMGGAEIVFEYLSEYLSAGKICL